MLQCVTQYHHKQKHETMIGGQLEKDLDMWCIVIKRTQMHS